MKRLKRRKIIRKPIPVITLDKAAQILGGDVKAIRSLCRLRKLKLFRLMGFHVVEEPQVLELRRHPRIVARAARLAAQER